MTPDQQRRYIRQSMLTEFGEAGQAKLLAARVLVVGAGGLGSANISYLAAAGIGTIGVIDPDRVELSNLARQILHETGDIGRLKVDSAADRVAEINPDVTFIAHPFAINAENAEAVIMGSFFHPPLEGESKSFLRDCGGGNLPKDTPYQISRKRNLAPPQGGSVEDRRNLTVQNSRLTAHYHLVADGCDNFAARFAVNDACVKLGIPLVSAAIAGWHGQLMTIMPGGPDYRALVHPDAPEANTCTDSGIVGPLAGIVGCCQALEIIRVILGRPAYAGKLLRYDGLSGTQRIVSLPTGH